MSDSVRDAYIASIDQRFVPLVLALDKAVMDACPELDTKISYKLLTYGIKGDFRYWVCSIGTSKSRVSLRFLFGVLLDDPRGLFRAGTSNTLRTIDFEPGDEVDPTLIAGYVTQAVARLDYFREHERKLREGGE